MRFRTKFLAWVVVMSLVLMIGVSTIPQAKAQFVIASWDYPDAYSQGILQIRVNENSTGSWVLVDVRTYANETNFYEWEVGSSIQLYVWVYLNSTHTGASSLADGRNYQQLNVTVTTLGETIFTLQNFTFQDENDYAEMYLYEYDAILNFSPQQGLVYTVTVTYEVWY